MPSEQEFPLWPDNPTAEDLLGFEDVAAPIIDALNRERLDPVALGVFGDWGSGKTTVLKLIEAELAEDGRVVVVYTQPWEYDPATDPKAALIGEVLGAIAGHVKKEQGSLGDLADKFKDLAKRVRWSKAIGLAARTAVSLTPPSFEDVVGIFEEDGEDREPTLQGFREEFASLMAQVGSVERVVVLVDDLDRCLPDTVVGTLEAIKLFLSAQKMGFVIAADERLVQHAISTKYQGAGAANLMAQQYLEKIVQIPLRVPGLGEGDTEAYLALLLLHRHFQSDADGFGRIIEHIKARRADSEPRVLEELPQELLPADAREELAIAAQLAPVLAERVEGNPRRLKRFMNAYWLRADIARRRKAELEPAVTAKLLLLERLDDAGFRILLDWLRAGDLDKKLKRVEEAEGEDGLDTDEVALLRWAKEGSRLADKELGPYLRLAASLKSLPGVQSELRGELQELLGGLGGEEEGPRSTAADQAATLPASDQVSLVQELVRMLVTVPERQSRIAKALAMLGSKSEDASREITTRLARLDPRLVEPDLIIRVGELPGGPELVRTWLESGDLTEIAANAAKAGTNGGPS